MYSQGAGRWAVFIEVFNRTDHPVRWVSSALETKDERIFYLMEHPPGGELPAVIQPHDSHHTWVDCHELERQGLGARRAGDRPAAKLATGEIYRSPAKRLAGRRSFQWGRRRRQARRGGEMRERRVVCDPSARAGGEEPS